MREREYERKNETDKQSIRANKREREREESKSELKTVLEWKARILEKKRNVYFKFHLWAVSMKWKFSKHRIFL